MTTDTTFEIGQLVRITRATPSGLVSKKYIGRLMTVRALDTTDRNFGVRVDDGDPKNDDLTTNGFDLAVWAPVDCLTAVGGER